MSGGLYRLNPPADLGAIVRQNPARASFDYGADFVPIVGKDGVTTGAATEAAPATAVYSATAVNRGWLGSLLGLGSGAAASGVTRYLPALALGGLVAFLVVRKVRS